MKDSAPAKRRFHLSENTVLRFEDAIAASRGELQLALDPEWAKELDRRRQVIIRGFVEGGATHRAYGWNTGFADNRNSPTVPLEKLGLLQDGLIRSHAAAYGERVPDDVVRLALVLRACSLAKGVSGVRAELVRKVIALANSGCVPVVPKIGSLGASGDLAPLSHLALALMGEGTIRVPSEDGSLVQVQNSEALAERYGFYLEYSANEELGVEAHGHLGPKEGLAFNNGTGFMAAALALAASRLDNVLWHADLGLCLTMDSMASTLDAFLPELHALRPYPGTQAVAERVRRLLEAGASLKGRNLTSNLCGLEDLNSAARGARCTDHPVYDVVQDDYSIRAASVVHGAVLHALEHTKAILVTEFNSANDNPLSLSIDGQCKLVSGPHFHGSVLALPADYMRTAMAALAGISERRVAKLMNPRRNYGGSKYLVDMASADAPIQSGWMIAQYTGAALVNELKTRAMPYSVGNVTSGNESEDYVSMGGNACRAAYETMDLLEAVIGIEIGAAARQIWLRGPEWQARCSKPIRAVMALIADQKPAFDVFHSDDRPLNPILEGLADLVRSGALRDAADPA